MPEKNKCYNIEITDISSDGNGVGAVDGFTIFVPMTAIGDICEVLIVKVLSRYAIGRLMEIKRPSPDRVTPECPSFKRCGGCHLQHIDYASQLRIKKNFVDSAMQRIGGFADFACDEILGMERPERYRNKCVYPIGTDKSGRVISGFYARRSHDIIEVGDCILGGAVNERINAAVLSYMRENNVLPYDEKTHTGLVRRTFIRCSGAGAPITGGTGDEVPRETNPTPQDWRAGGLTEIMVVISVNGDTIPHRERLIKRLCAVSEDIVSIYININKEKNNTVLGRDNKLIYGKAAISDTLCGIRFEISPHSFYQVNPYMTERLYNKAIEYADITPEDTVLDVYCGIGTITLAAAARAKKAIGIEIVRQAIKNAKENAKNNGIGNAEFFADSAENAVPKLIEGGMRPDIVILDPPRKGSDEKTLSAVASASPKRIVYVSCNPATLARDTKYLATLGYTPVRATATDMFPHTCHVETVCLLYKLKSSEHIDVELSMDEMDLTAAEKKATYQELKDFVFEHYGLKVSQLNIAQVKRKFGIIERENYNKAKSDDLKQPNCTQEKEMAIIDALKHFGMI